MGIPDRWLNYSNIGDVIPSTNFIAFKIPLRDIVCDRLPDEKKHTTRHVLENIPSGKRLGMVINLTNTNSDRKYYDPNDWSAAGGNIGYTRVRVEGHVTPSRSVLIRFFEHVNEFLKTDPDSLIGVHCTHGVNRTGFFIAAYMIVFLSMDPKEALEKFATGRGHKVERDNYINYLKKLPKILEHDRNFFSINPNDKKRLTSDREVFAHRGEHKRFKSIERFDPRDHRRPPQHYRDNNWRSQGINDYHRQPSTSSSSFQPQFVGRPDFYQRPNGREEREYSQRFQNRAAREFSQRSNKRDERSQEREKRAPENFRDVPKRNFRQDLPRYVSPDPSSLPVPKFAQVPIPNPPMTPREIPQTHKIQEPSKNSSTLWSDLFKIPKIQKKDQYEPQHPQQRSWYPQIHQSQNKKWINPNLQKP